MSGRIIQAGQSVPFTGTGNVRVGTGVIDQIIPASSTSGTVALYDSATTTTSVPILAATPLTAGVPLPIHAVFESGLYIVVTGTLSASAIIG